MSADPELSAVDGLGDIAIIAMQCRFPGADDLAAYWSLLTEEREGARSLDGLAAAPGLVRREAVIDGIDQFDADFFGYLPAEAAMIDPGQRVFLECAYHVFEQAAYDPERYPGLVGVYAGAGQPTYLMANVLPHLGLDPSSPDALPAGFANSSASLAGRVSYHFDLQGPSIAVNTACSTSLVAVHLACQDLLDYRCDLALAGGVSLNPSPGKGYRYVPDGPLSPDGRCRAFDARAAGMFPGDGVGVVLLKRLADALADGDRIRAVVKGSAVGNDGRRKAGFTAPGVRGQSEVIVAAQAIAGVEASSIGMIEAHGTGTPVGDPIEVAALTKAFRQTTDQTGYCLLGSAKTNIGHTDAAAGVAGLIKAVLSIEHGVVPANLHYTAPNPLIDFADSPFRVAGKTAEWPDIPGPRRAGVSAFGIGGTNAHVVLEQAPDINRSAQPDSVSRSETLLVLSAATPEALQTQADGVAEHLSCHGDDIAGIAETLQFGRCRLPYRHSLVCESSTHAITALQAPLEPTQAGEGSVPLVLLFPGSGAQYPGMGRELYETERVFRSTIDECAQILAHNCDIDLHDQLYRNDRLDDGQPDSVFPAVFATQYALARQLAAWGLSATAILGHSLGEYTAACLAGVMQLDQALPLVSARGRLFARAGGATTSVLLAAEQVEPLLGGRVVVSGITSAASCTVSGPLADIAEVEGRLRKQGVQFQRLRVALAVHSPQLDPVLGEFADILAEVRLRPPQVPYLSNVTGTWIRPEEATDPAYWVRHSREPVQLAAGFQELAQLSGAVLVEVGPGRTLTRIARQHLGNLPAVATMRHRDDQTSDRHALLAALGTAWEHGIDIDWQALSGPRRHARVELPGYPFQRQRYWLEPPETGKPVNSADAVIPVRQGGAPGVPEPAQAPAAKWSNIASELRRHPIESLISAEATAELRALDELCTAYLCGFLRESGVDLTGGQQLSRTEIITRLEVVPAFHRLIDVFTRILVEDDILACEGDRFRVRESAVPRVPDLEAWCAENPESASRARLLDRCLRGYDRVLRGDLSGNEIVMPGGDDSAYRAVVEQRIHHSDFAAHRKTIADTVLRVARGVTGTQPLRILEIGAGRGYLTWPIVEVLRERPPGGVEYWFTDIGRSFVLAGQQRAESEGLDFLRFATLDIGAEPARQQVPLGEFDIVLAFNVLHVVPDLRAGIRHTAEFTAPGGVVLVLEATRVERWDSLIDPLWTGWLDFADDIRTDSPLLAPARWAMLLDENGYTAARAHCSGDTADHALIVAERTGPAGQFSRAADPNSTSSFNQRPPLSTEYCCPRTDLEQRIAAIWQRCFGYDRIGVHDRFLELGGESLLAMQIAAQQRSELGIETSMRRLLEAGTVAAVAAAASNAVPDRAPVSKSAPEAESESTSACEPPPARRGRAARRTATGEIVVEEAGAR